MDRLFSYFAAAKIVQTEGRTKEKPKDFLFVWKRCSLSYVKIVQTESRTKEKPKDF